MSFTLMTTHHFDKHKRGLADHDRTHVDKAMVELARDPHYPALRTKHLHAAAGGHEFFESSANMDIRIIWHHLDDITLSLLDVGHHDMLRAFDHTHYLN
jgi:hypothetical protein